METGKKAFASEMSHSRDWDAQDGDPAKVIKVISIVIHCLIFSIQKQPFWGQENIHGEVQFQ